MKDYVRYNFESWTGFGEIWGDSIWIVERVIRKKNYD